VREHVDKERDELAIERLSQVLRGRESGFVGGAPIQADHQILDHHHLPA
jgi:hypothetical protein